MTTVKTIRRRKSDRDDQPSFITFPLRLPHELLPILVETSEYPRHTYIQLLGLCHATRTAVRGAPRVLAFFDGVDEEDPLIRQVATPTTDALAALVGPCLGLVKLTLDFETLPARWWCFHTEAACARWVDEAFAGHSRLAVLEIVTSWSTVMLALPRIVGHLHGLEEFRLRVRYHGSPDWDLNPSVRPLLTALGQSCPRLRLLHLEQTSSGIPFLELNGVARLHCTVLQGLAPIAGTLKDIKLPFRIGDAARTEEGRENIAAGTAFLRSLASVQKLSFSRCPADLLRPLAPQLTQLGLTESWFRVPPVEDFRRLKRLELAHLLPARPSSPSPLKGLLDGLPHLTDLTLLLEEVSSYAALFDVLPVGLLDRLERLALHLGFSSEGEEAPCSTTHIASLRLRTLCFDNGAALVRIVPNPTILELACPRLEELVLPEMLSGALKKLILDCPQLRTIKGLPSHCRNRWTAMPYLVRVRECPICDREGGRGHLLDGIPQLLEESPQLLELPFLSIRDPAILARLLASRSLTRLSVEVSLNALPSLRRTRSRDVRALQLPAQLERLQATFKICSLPTDDPPPDLLVEAAGLRSLTVWLELSDRLLRRRPALGIRCPALVALDADLSRFTSFSLDVPSPSLLNLAFSAMQSSKQSESVAGLSDCLAATTTLRRALLQGRGLSDWSRLIAALGQLPHLAALDLTGFGTAEVALACPHLRWLSIGGTAMLRSLALDCPLLEMLQLWGDFRYLERFEWVGPVPPNLHLQCPGKSSKLARRFPWVRQLLRSS
ncbi:hypothetical protein PAPYR_8215 [Paratrimastix pyriformis]|uniref:F-box domain-containing protein n=1 Tax=Paratrimastix pyriformis TaxID=342808 RepID=A0ABQ8UCH8_9EUKA|nr:hypothetical protein PAPYR_8215 [Paratrimastix pyriformis]